MRCWGFPGTASSSCSDGTGRGPNSQCATNLCTTNISGLNNSNPLNNGYSFYDAAGVSYALPPWVETSPTINWNGETYQFFSSRLPTYWGFADLVTQPANNGYQSNFLYGSHQSVTKDWAMPMHQTDTLFHKAKVAQAFIFGGEADNHAINTVPKETLVKITKAESGGQNAQGAWEPGRRGTAPAGESDLMKSYIAGKLNTVRRA